MEVLENLVDTLELDEITSDDSRNILQNFTMEEVRDVILPFEWNLEKSTLVLKVLDQMTESDPEISSNDAEIIRKLACINYQVLVSYRFCTDSSHRDIRSLRRKQSNQINFHRLIIIFFNSNMQTIVMYGIYLCSCRLWGYWCM